MQPQQREVKVVLLGDAGVGKSSIQMRFVNNDFKEDKESTLGAVFQAKQITVDGESYKYQIWDTAGQEKYHSLAPLYYKDSAVAIICYDITKKESFTVLKNWVNELRQHGPENQIIAIVGNKLDLIEQEEVTYDEAKEYARSLDAIFKLTSAKLNQNITDLFEEISRRIVNLDEEQTIKKTENKVLNNKKKDKKKGGCC